MGLVSDLAYRHRPPNALQRGLQKLASTEKGALAASKFLPRADKTVHRVTKGKVSLPQVFTALPVVMVTTVGRKSGQKRTTPLVAIPVGDDLALLGTNFGGAKTPAWALNLEVDPSVEVEYSGRSSRAVARHADDSEREQVWEGAGRIYGGYDQYQQRITDRDIRIFVLDPEGSEHPDGR